MKRLIHISESAIGPIKKAFLTKRNYLGCDYDVKCGKVGGDIVVAMPDVSDDGILSTFLLVRREVAEDAGNIRNVARTVFAKPMSITHSQLMNVFQSHILGRYLDYDDMEWDEYRVEFVLPEGQQALSRFHNELLASGGMSRNDYYDLSDVAESTRKGNKKKRRFRESSEFRFDKTGEAFNRANGFKIGKYLEVWVSVAPADPQQDTGALTVSLVEGSGPDSFGSALDAKYEIRIEDEYGNAEEWTSEGVLDRAKAELKNAIRRFKKDYGIELYKDDDWLDMMNEDLMNESTKKSFPGLYEDVILLDENDFDPYDELYDVLSEIETEHFSWGDWDGSNCVFKIQYSNDDEPSLIHRLFSGSKMKKLEKEVNIFLKETKDAVNKWLGQCDIDPTIGSLKPFIYIRRPITSSIMVGIEVKPNGNGFRKSTNNDDWEETGLSESTKRRMARRARLMREANNEPTENIKTYDVENDGEYYWTMYPGVDVGLVQELVSGVDPNYTMELFQSKDGFDELQIIDRKGNIVKKEVIEW